MTGVSAMKGLQREEVMWTRKLLLQEALPQIRPKPLPRPQFLLDAFYSPGMQTWPCCMNPKSPVVRMFGICAAEASTVRMFGTRVKKPGTCAFLEHCSGVNSRSAYKAVQSILATGGSGETQKQPFIPPSECKLGG